MFNSNTESRTGNTVNSCRQTQTCYTKTTQTITSLLEVYN